MAEKKDKTQWQKERQHVVYKHFIIIIIFIIIIHVIQQTSNWWIFFCYLNSKDNTYGRHTKNLQSRETDLATPISSQLIAGIVHDLNFDHDYEKKILSLLQSESQILCIAHELWKYFSYFSSLFIRTFFL